VSILVDSSVLLDIWAEQAEWWEWSSSNLARLGESSVLNINPIIYAEVSPRFASLAELDAAIRPIGLDRVDLPWDAAFLAGRSFVEYRRRGGARTSPLPDFYIGAHALVSGMTLLTRDASRFRTYFPELSLIAPDA
jgi:predicted nucleic acid-binding protein